MQDQGPAGAAAPRSSARDRRFASDLVEHLVVPTFVIDTTGHVLVWNKACERLTGVPAAAVMGTADHWMGFYAARRPCLADLVLHSRFGEIEAHYSDVSAFGLNDFGAAVESWCDLPRSGRRVYLAIDAGPIYDATGAVIAVVETLRDITAQREAQDALTTLAALDGLTGLANRRSFDQALATESQRSARAGSPLSLLMMDVDGFKLFNDSYGHAEGDECLRRVARTLAAVVRRAGDVAARYGGEEFAVILPDTDLQGAAVIAERIRRAVEDLRIAHRAAPVGRSVTLSLGGASTRGPEPDVPGLLAEADSALYRAKRGGRNRVVVGPVALPPFAPRRPVLDCA